MIRACIQAPFLAGLIFILGWSQAQAGGLEARLDRTRVAEGETVILNLSASGDTQGTPDLSPLAQDFDVLNQSQSTHMSFINGSGSTTREWQLVLAPKRNGRLTLPALRLGSAISQSQILEVVPADQAAKLGQSRPVLLEVEAGPESPYVQGQVIYTVRVLARVQLHQAGLSEPQAGDAIVEHLGEDKSYTSYRDGQQYTVIERRYAIFPQHSGKLEIEPPLLSARIPQQGKRRQSLHEQFFGRDPFGSMGGIFQQTRPVQLRGKKLSLEVKPQPTVAPTPWLPAESLTLSEDWSPGLAEWRVGEPVTRSIAITAQGLTASQLPDLTAPVPAGIKVYQDKAQSETRAEVDTLVAQKVLKAALVPSREGELTLPEVRLAWWDTVTDQLRIASLPARTLHVLPPRSGSSAQNPLSQSPAPVSPKQAVQGHTGTITASLPQVDAKPASDPVASLGLELIEDSPLPAGYWPWISAGLALGWLLTLGLWWRSRGSVRIPAATAGEAETLSRPNLGKLRNQVQQACNANDPRQARARLLEWAVGRWPDEPPRRLEALAQRLGGEAAGALSELDRRLYAVNPGDWQGTRAWDRLAGVLTGEKEKKAASWEDAPLPALYPRTPA